MGGLNGGSYRTRRAALVNRHNTPCYAPARLDAAVAGRPAATLIRIAMGGYYKDRKEAVREIVQLGEEARPLIPQLSHAVLREDIPEIATILVDAIIAAGGETAMGELTKLSMKKSLPEPVRKKVKEGISALKQGSPTPARPSKGARPVAG